MLVEESLDRVRKLAEQCENIDGFLVYHAVGGGTGSGFGSALLEHLSDDGNFGKKTKVSLSAYPSRWTATSPIECYNAILAKNYHLEHL